MALNMLNTSDCMDTNRFSTADRMESLQVVLYVCVRTCGLLNSFESDLTITVTCEIRHISPVLSLALKNKNEKLLSLEFTSG